MKIKFFKFGLLLSLISIGFLGIQNNLFAAGGDDHSPQGETVTLKGEILDLHCFMLHPDSGQGPKHAKCATSCINKGLAAGFISDGEVYLLLGKGHDSVKKTVAEHAGKPVAIEGRKIEHHGVKAFQVHKVHAKGKEHHQESEGSHGHDHSGHNH